MLPKLPLLVRRFIDVFYLVHYFLFASLCHIRSQLAATFRSTLYISTFLLTLLA